MKRILKEPLVHFLALGALLFASYGVLDRGGAPAPDQIVISQGQLASMRETFNRTWQRPPTREEWDGLIRDRIREEVYCREAIALGLDKDDTVIRRRLRQKMEFVSDDIAAQAQPTDAELNVYLQAHADKFRVEQQFTFQQVYLNPQKHGDKLTQLNQAGSQADVATLGDSFLLERDFTAVPVGEIAKQFGEEFARKLVKLPSGQWQGPVESSFGLHLVKISERTEGRQPALAEVRDVVSREWANARRLEANEKFFAELLKRYTVTIEEVKPVEGQKKVAEVK